MMNECWMMLFPVTLMFFSDPENKTPDHSPSSAWFCVSQAASHAQIHNKNKAGHTRVGHTAMFSGCQRFDHNLCWAASQFLMGSGNDWCLCLHLLLIWLKGTLLKEALLLSCIRLHSLDPLGSCNYVLLLLSRRE